jgi:galactokinase/mevalonate kinase-like predicted kinase
LLESILNFFYSINPNVVVQAPSRINLINPLDAVEGDFWMPSIAITGISNPLSVFLYLKKTPESNRLKIYNIKKTTEGYQIELEYEESICKNFNEISKKFNDDSKLVYASIYRLYKTNQYFLECFKKQDFELGILSTIPRQSGLGGSAAIVISILYGFAKFFKIYNNTNHLKKNEVPINKDIIAEMATKVEDEDLRITAGYGDRYVISRGGITFCSYHGKLFHKQISKEPLAVYDRIDKTYKIDNIPIIIAYSGISHESGNIHEKLRKLYLEKEPKIIKDYKKLAKISWKSRFALMKKDWNDLGKLFKKNTIIMNKIMKDADFEYGIGIVNNLLIHLIENHKEVYAAKLTGAGGGGSVFALTNPNKIDDVLGDWKRKLDELINDKEYFKKQFPHYPIEIVNQLKHAEFFKIGINKKGVTILKKNHN